MVEIHIIYVAALIAYNLAVTGFWVFALTGGHKECEKQMMQKALYERVINKLKSRVWERDAAFIRLSSDVQTMEKRILDMEKDVDGEALQEQRNANMELLKRYVAVQNEYAWYRMMVREIDAEGSRQIELMRSAREGAEQ